MFSFIKKLFSSEPAPLPENERSLREPSQKLEDNDHDTCGVEERELHSSILSEDGKTKPLDTNVDNSEADEPAPARIKQVDSRTLGLLAVVDDRSTSESTEKADGSSFWMFGPPPSSCTAEMYAAQHLNRSPSPDDISASPEDITETTSLTLNDTSLSQWVVLPRAPENVEPYQGPSMFDMEIHEDYAFSGVLAGAGLEKKSSGLFDDEDEEEISAGTGRLGQLVEPPAALAEASISHVQPVRSELAKVAQLSTTSAAPSNVPHGQIVSSEPEKVPQLSPSPTAPSEMDNALLKDSALTPHTQDDPTSSAIHQSPPPEPRHKSLVFAGDSHSSSIFDSVLESNSHSEIDDLFSTIDREVKDKRELATQLATRQKLATVFDFDNDSAGDVKDVQSNGLLEKIKLRQTTGVGNEIASQMGTWEHQEELILEEERRKAAERRTAEEDRKRLEEEERKAEEERREAERRRGEEERKRLEEEERKAEEKQREAERRRAEEERKRLEEERKAEEKRREAKRRRAEEERKRLEEEERKAEEKRRGADRRRAEEEKKRLEEERKAEEKRREAERRAEEEKKRLEEKERKAEEKRREDETRRAEEEKKRLEEKERKVEEERREAERRAKEERKRLEEDVRKAEERREAERRQAEEERKRVEKGKAMAEEEQAEAIEDSDSDEFFEPEEGFPLEKVPPMGKTLDIDEEEDDDDEDNSLFWDAVEEEHDNRTGPLEKECPLFEGSDTGLLFTMEVEASIAKAESVSEDSNTKVENVSNPITEVSKKENVSRDKPVCRGSRRRDGRSLFAIKQEQARKREMEILDNKDVSSIDEFSTRRKELELGARSEELEIEPVVGSVGDHDASVGGIQAPEPVQKREAPWKQKIIQRRQARLKVEEEERRQAELRRAEKERSRLEIEAQKQRETEEKKKVEEQRKLELEKKRAENEQRKVKEKEEQRIKREKEQWRKKEKLVEKRLREQEEEARRMMEEQKKQEAQRIHQAALLEKKKQEQEHKRLKKLEEESQAEKQRQEIEELRREQQEEKERLRKEQEAKLTKMTQRDEQEQRARLVILAAEAAGVPFKKEKGDLDLPPRFREIPGASKEGEEPLCGSFDPSFLPQAMAGLTHLTLKRSRLKGRKPASRRPIVDQKTFKRAEVNVPGLKKDQTTDEVKKDQDLQMERSSKPSKIGAGRGFGVGNFDPSVVRLRKVGASSESRGTPPDRGTTTPPVRGTAIRGTPPNRKPATQGSAESSPGQELKRPDQSSASLSDVSSRPRAGSAPVAAPRRLSPFKQAQLAKEQQRPRSGTGSNVPQNRGNEGIRNLLTWAQTATAAYEGVNVTNFTTSFKDGMAFCALIHRKHPKLIDFKSLNPSNARENLTLAFETAKRLGVPQLIDVDDIVSLSIPEKLSMITYLSEFAKVLR